MCPIAAESKNSKSRSKKKLNKNINPSAETELSNNTVEKVVNNGTELENNNQNLSEDDEKNLANIKLGPKGIYTEDSIRVYLQEIGRIRLLRPDEEIELARKIADLLQLEELATQYESEKGHFPTVREWAELIDMPLSKFRRRLLLGRRAKEKNGSI